MKLAPSFISKEAQAMPRAWEHTREPRVQSYPQACRRPGPQAHFFGLYSARKIASALVLTMRRVIRV